MQTDTQIAEVNADSSLSNNEVEVPDARPNMRYSGYNVKAGWLTKRSGGLIGTAQSLMNHGFGGHTFGISKKKKRYLTLRGSMLSCWKRENDTVPIWENGLQAAEIEGEEDKLTITIKWHHRAEEFALDNHMEWSDWMEALQSATNKSIKDYYSLVSVLGQGHFGKVLLGKDIRTGEKFAVKVIRKQRAHVKSREKIRREVEIMRLVKHKNVLRLYDLFETAEKLYFVLEFMEGGPLYEVLSSSDHVYTEDRARVIIRDVLEGLQYLHTHHVVHRDVKPDNVLTSSRRWPFTCKLADFGLSNFLMTESDTLESKVGTPYFCAREVISTQTYGTKADLWSTGVMIYEMLSGNKPFEGNGTRAVLQKIMEARYSFPESRWANISHEAKDLIRLLICVDVDRRLSAIEALQHPWITNRGRDQPIGLDLSTQITKREQEPNMNEVEEADL